MIPPPLPTDVKKKIMSHILQHPKMLMYMRQNNLPYMEKRQNVMTELRQYTQRGAHQVFADLEKQVLFPFDLLRHLINNHYIDDLRHFITSPNVAVLSHIHNHVGFISVRNIIYSIVFGKDAKKRAFLSAYGLGGEYQGSLRFRCITINRNARVTPAESKQTTHPVFQDLKKQVLFPFDLLHYLINNYYIDMFQHFIVSPDVAVVSRIHQHVGSIPVGNAIYDIVFGKDGKKKVFLSAYNFAGKYEGSLRFRLPS